MEENLIAIDEKYKLVIYAILVPKSINIIVLV